MASNGRVKGQISLKGKGRMSVRGNPNSGTNRNTGNVRLSQGPTISSGKQVSRNSSSKTASSAHAGQTVGLKGAKVGYVHRYAPIANSVPDRTTMNPSQYNTHVSPTVGLRGAGRPNSESKRTTTQFDSVPDKISKNTRKQNPHTSYGTGGLFGATKNGAKGTASRSNLGRSPGDKNSLNPYVNPPHANDTQGLTKISKRAPKQSLQSHGTHGQTGGSRKTGFMGNRRQVTSSLKPQRVFNADIPAAVRKAAARAPSVGSSKPSFTSRVARILSK